MSDARHRGLTHFAKYFLKDLGYKIFDTEEHGKPDLIICDRFGNLVIVEILTHPTKKVIREKIDKYVKGDVSKIIFVVPWKDEEIVELYNEEYIEFISPREEIYVDKVVAREAFIEKYYEPSSY